MSNSIIEAQQEMERYRMRVHRSVITSPDMQNQFKLNNTMKKEVVITLVDSTIITEDLTHTKGIPFGAKANDVFFVQLVASIFVNGYHKNDSNEKRLITVAPAQIKQIEVVFS